MFPNCPFCDDGFSIIEPREEDFKKHFQFCKDLSHIEPLVLYEDDSMIQKPLHLKMSTYVYRFITLAIYDYSDKIKYANSGFYYTGVADIVACFWCGGKLACWSFEDDDPLVEHVKHFPKCLFAKLAWMRNAPFPPFYLSNVLPVQQDSDFISKCYFCDRNIVDLDHVLHCYLLREATPRYQEELYDEFRNLLNVTDFKWPKSRIDLIQNKRDYDEMWRDIGHYNSSENFVYLLRWERNYDKNLKPKKRDIPLPKTDRRCKFCKKFIDTFVSHFWMCPDLMKKYSMFTYESGPRYPKQINPLNRLKSLKDWPNSNKKMIGALVTSGFFFDDDIFTCFFCGRSVTKWKYDEDPLEKHAKLFPDCSYADWYFNIKNPIPSMTIMKEEESQRLETFDFWPTKLCDPCILTEMGFIYLLKENRVQCVFCKLVVNDCMVDTFRIHQRKSPNCPLILGEKTDNVPLKTPWKTVISGPRNTEMKNFFNRLNTFTIKDQSEQNLAKSGFYYTGEIVECFWCGDPMKEHLKESKCLFAIYNQEKSIVYEEKQVMCKACFKNECKILFLECGHLACCEPCSKLVDKCIICHSLITRKIRAYI